MTSSLCCCLQSSKNRKFRAPFSLQGGLKSLGAWSVKFKFCTLNLCCRQEVCTRKMSKRTRKVAFQEEVGISDKRHKENEGDGEEESELGRSECAPFGIHFTPPFCTARTPQLSVFNHGHKPVGLS